MAICAMTNASAASRTWLLDSKKKTKNKKTMDHLCLRSSSLVFASVHWLVHKASVSSLESRLVIDYLVCLCTISFAVLRLASGYFKFAHNLCWAVMMINSTANPILPELLPVKVLLIMRDIKKECFINALRAARLSSLGEVYWKMTKQSFLGEQWQRCALS